VTNRVRDVLLEEDETGPVIVSNPHGSSSFLLLGDHAGNAIPRSLGTFGVCRSDRERHIAWDIGVRAVGSHLAKALDAVFIHQHYSRLVIDCNRDPSHPESVAVVTDGTHVSANSKLSSGQRALRIDSIHRPYHAHIAGEVERRRELGRPTIIIALHSFTPTMSGQDRPWHIGILHNGGNERFARILLDLLKREDDIIAGDNEPYRMDETDYTVPRHAFSNGLAYVEIEIRQDLIADPRSQTRMGNRFAALLTAAAKASAL
jgi:predicted N-formylglutamate amidohydrolase